MERLTKKEKRNALAAIGKAVRFAVNDGTLNHYGLSQLEREFAEEWCEALADQLIRANGHA